MNLSGNYEPNNQNEFDFQNNNQAVAAPDAADYLLKNDFIEDILVEKNPVNNISFNEGDFSKSKLLKSDQK